MFLDILLSSAIRKIHGLPHLSFVSVNIATAKASSATGAATRFPMHEAVYKFLGKPELSAYCCCRGPRLGRLHVQPRLKKLNSFNPVFHPSCRSAVKLPERRVCLSRALSAEDEDLMESAILKYSDDGWPLTSPLFKMLAEHYLANL